MQLTLNNRIIGAACGILAGLVFVIAGWRTFLILVGFGAAGFLIGLLTDARGQISQRMKAFFARIPGS